MNKDTSDGELIREYVANGNNRAFEILMRRHYDNTYRRFLKNCRDPQIAQDLTQSLWENQVKKLSNYRDQGKYAHFLMSCVSNSLTDYWRSKGVRDKVISQNYDDLNDPIDMACDNQIDTAMTTENQQQIDYLTTQLIPALPCDQRLVFLLKHESEYWEEKQRLEWKHLASLNNSDVETVWKSFENHRNSLLEKMHGAEVVADSSCEKNLLFLVWTQSQRPFKDQDFTWNYFSKILNLSENTLKTRYRAALKALSAGLIEYNKAGTH